MKEMSVGRGLVKNVSPLDIQCRKCLQTTENPKMTAIYTTKNGASNPAFPSVQNYQANLCFLLSIKNSLVALICIIPFLGSWFCISENE